MGDPKMPLLLDTNPEYDDFNLIWDAKQTSLTWIDDADCADGRRKLEVRRPQSRNSGAKWMEKRICWPAIQELAYFPTFIMDADLVENIRRLASKDRDRCDPTLATDLLATDNIDDWLNGTHEDSQTKLDQGAELPPVSAPQSAADISFSSLLESDDSCPADDLSSVDTSLRTDADSRGFLRNRGSDRSQSRDRSQSPALSPEEDTVESSKVAEQATLTCPFGCINPRGKPRRYRRREHRDRHVRTTNESTIDAERSCKVCKKVLSRHDNLLAHRRTHGKPSSRKRIRYIASLDMHSEHYDPTFEGPWTHDGLPIR